MKKIILILILAAAALSASAVFTDEMEISGYRGEIEIRDGKPWLKELWGDEMRLLLGPQALLDSLGLALADGDSVSVEGFREKDLFLVGKLWLDGGEFSLYWLRYLDWGDLTTGVPASYQVNPQQCIGCKLCVINCPMGAITMIKGKAHIDLEKCTECGICIDGHNKFKGCPTGAISPK